MNAADVMVTSVICVRANASVESVAETLLMNRISAVPVLDEDGAMVGIVSEGDLIHRVEADTERHRSWWLELLTSRQILAQEFVKSHGRKAADVMTRTVISVKPDTPLGKVAAILEKHRIKRVPVVAGGNIVGIVSRANLIQALVRPDNEIAPAPQVSDLELRENVLAQLKSKPWWPNDINVVVRDGTVELWGIVDTEIEKDAIRVAVEVTPGVRVVADNLGLKNAPIAQQGRA